MRQDIGQLTEAHRDAIGAHRNWGKASSLSFNWGHARTASEIHVENAGHIFAGRKQRCTGGRDREHAVTPLRNTAEHGMEVT
jgi:hypothetical protein